MWEFLPPMNYDVLFYPFAVGCIDGRFYAVPWKMDNIIQVYDPHDHAQVWKIVEESNVEGNAHKWIADIRSRPRFYFNMVMMYMDTIKIIKPFQGTLM